MEDLQQQFRQSRNKVDTVGLSTSVGKLLRKQRLLLPNMRTLQESVGNRQPQIDEAQLALFDYNDERALIADPERRARQIVDTLDPDAIADVEKDVLVSEATDLLTRRRDILDPLMRSQNALFDSLAEISVMQQQLVDVTEEFSNYIDERVLWVRSADPLQITPPKNEVASVWTSAVGWRGVLEVLQSDFRSRLFLWLTAGILWVALIAVTWPFAGLLSQFARVARRSSCQTMAPTLRTLGVAIILTLRLVVPLFFLSWRLKYQATDLLTGSVADAFDLAARVALPVEFFRQVVCVNGLADAHFDWSTKTVSFLRRQLRWFTPVVVPLAFVASLVSSKDSVRGPSYLERWYFLAACLVAGWFVYRLLHPKRGIPANYLAQNESGWWSRLSGVWFFAAVALPLVIAGLSAAGFVYTADQLAWRAFKTVAMLAIFATMNSLVARALLVYRRARYIAEARKRYAEAESQKASAPTGEAAKDAAAKSIVEEVIRPEDALADLRSQTLQARRLAAAILTGVALLGLWVIWRDVMPALVFLERWPLWESTAYVADTVELEGGGFEERTRQIRDPVTVAELILALFVFGLSLFAARDVPGLTEITILNRLPLEKSVRYAITTLVSYALVLAGLVVACNLIGIHWNQIQWMATALTFGLAFGLQEMFANFVAGIIILFERPVRVGDIVTVDEVSGVVSKVRIRATTITNWDRQDYIVPNKDFITGRVLNWTLTDYVNRIVIPIGVAYGTDTELAKSIMLRLAVDHPLIVAEPAPFVTFEGFGDSTLNLIIRCYIAIKDMPSRIRVIDELNTAIDREFKLSKIEIAFPQRDLHIRTLPAEFKRD